ncbi:ECF transporter S component [Halothermothrix orenii]|uniref:Predicted membrane protein n=1 Tax=Halothermothrix orenii (strain H 168 / OCM 544 / DSM 9562) TaxID=373903 RepID=B8D021_HALOH|nr:ECF transporter S component [Halothermothrix orenii]ACL70873.1 predicted membrane protein [Halothermothrix orenii H 168]
MPDRRIVKELRNLEPGNLSTRTLSYLALFVAFTAVATYLHVPGPSQSYFNLGEVAIYFIALVFGPRAAGIAGAAGSALMDMILGYYIWAPFTFIIKGVEGYVVGRFGSTDSWVKSIVAVLIGGHIMIAGYAITKGFLISWAAIIPELGIDYAQMLIGAVIAIPFAHNINKFIGSDSDENRKDSKK